ncbi:replication restart helicase PriA [Tuwongella immobilis]|uniref:Replication restart protein PriA n=1 Tax=Tuwongella immobilis TaxID=692036 RepID=A0A6C2YQ25_9BACT|nr:primosomal protein N' [Tuwongella immobilis]VIP03279.1 primosomal protein n : Primosomal protein N OS=Singulisphaera acidiphila (strain ATCC BAA-1392 / DSM 18658 / VKM B-2454 / MOB10) GN=Sinac_7288 PE=4 SV=1: DEAD: Helicase_C [Tuwongella immobilis]VTS03924.1 primosomal protein n : Primosomal protein N OS=Singulisphaera acidiphila (strain ATCC BAA-1392 / DSM 18658 / VKM B-2454 / MOB10) GN=Sinac_7288 PE=4 SV=1: DEAD: Helicase_C [Tuwongella immobilis]
MDAEEIPAPEAHWFAEIVFDRPVDQPYTYSVPVELEPQIAVGKRVEVPFGRGDRTTIGFCVQLSQVKPVHPTKPILKVLDDEILLTAELLRLTRWMADYYLCSWGQVLQAVLPAGVREQAGMRTEYKLEAIPAVELPDHIASLTPKQTAIVKFLRRQTEPIHYREVMRQTKSTIGPINTLLSKGLVRKVMQKVDRELDSPGSTTRVPPPVLSGDQAAVWAELEAALRNPGYQAFLLHGVTGSGKTEVYLRAIEEVIRQGKEAIVLVPEISLTPQTIERFRGRCDSIAVLHSSQTDAERGIHWRRVAAGQVQVVVGARSAIFAPTRKLGLILIDEEHETSFKQESTPRYHARDVAVMRARLENIPIVMGSATPALESWQNAQRGNYRTLSLPNRVMNLPMPPVVLVDLRHENRNNRNAGAISETLEREMRNALQAGGQVMLLLNRRGFSTYVTCPTCGYVANCENCDLALTFHKHRSTMVCHHCGYEANPISLCPKCSKLTIRYQGHGTEKLHEEIQQKFPDRIVQRMDSDTMTKPGSHERVLDAFRNGLIHILLGTQMIAKGLDFPNVTLVGVINADVGLHLPDFRSAERTFQLLAQVAGRAGRGPKGGKVLVQTYTPEHPGISLAAQHDYLRFAQEELAQRQIHQYPPFQRIARIIIRSERQEAAETFAARLSGAFREAERISVMQGEAIPVRVLGPAEAPVFRLNGFYRYHFQIQSPSPGRLHQVIREVMTVMKAPGNVEFVLDIDPYSML